MQKSNINPEIVGELFASATNAADKGQSQFFTPSELARSLAEPLPSHRPIVCDLNCGHGALLVGAANATTKHVLGADIDTPRIVNASPALGVSNDKFLHATIQHDLTLLYPMLRELEWQADLFVLNPPWGLRWHRDRLNDLAESRLPAVREAFKAYDTMGKETLMIALDLMSSFGEGYLITNAAAMDRLLFNDGQSGAPTAPHRALVRHIWKCVSLDGNPMTGGDRNKWEEGDSKTNVIYFSAEWEYGPGDAQFATMHQHHRPRVHEFNAVSARTCLGKWGAAAERIKELKRPTPRYNLSLRDGKISVYLSTFQGYSRKVDKALAKRLDALQNQNPMQIVMQRAARNFLLQSVGLDTNIPSPWSVDPALRSAVESAMAEYNANRAPLRPLGKIQRIGWLDEQDSIKCERDLGPYLAGQVYPITSRTVEVTRKTFKPSITGKDEELELRGQELALFIGVTPCGSEPVKKDVAQKCFMDVRLLSKGTEVSGTPAEKFAHFTLQQLADCFHIPEVPDLATLFPERLASYQAQLTDIETFLNAA
jgi:predicted RNA methylase